jgi:hypothetical protein
VTKLHQNDADLGRENTGATRNPWPVALIVVIVGFILVIAMFITIASLQRTDLVDRRYYERGLAWDEEASRRTAADKLATPIRIEIAGAGRVLVLTFPEPFTQENTTGTITLYRPSNAEEDRTWPIELNREGVMVVPFDDALPEGLWRVNLLWERDGTAYAHSEDIIVPERQGGGSR